MTELQLIEGCKNGDRESQKLLYEKYARSMYGVCLRYSPSRESAEDLLQDGFLKVFAVIRSYTGKGSFEGWIKRVFINFALEIIRKEKSFTVYEDIQNIPDIAESQDEKINEISENDLLQIIQELPKGYQTVFNLYAIEDMSHKEIAQLLNIAEGTSRSQYIRARQILQGKVLDFFKRRN